MSKVNTRVPRYNEENPQQEIIRQLREIKSMGDVSEIDNVEMLPKVYIDIQPVLTTTQLTKCR